MTAPTKGCQDATTWSKNTATIIGEQVRAAIAKAKGDDNGKS